MNNKKCCSFIVLWFTAAYPCLFFSHKPLYSVQSAEACSCFLNYWLAKTASWSQMKMIEKKTIK